MYCRLNPMIEALISNCIFCFLFSMREVSPNPFCETVHALSCLKKVQELFDWSILIIHTVFTETHSNGAEHMKYL